RARVGIHAPERASNARVLGAASALERRARGGDARLRRRPAVWRGVRRAARRASGVRVPRGRVGGRRLSGQAARRGGHGQAGGWKKLDSGEMSPSRKPGRRKAHPRPKAAARATAEASAPKTLPGPALPAGLLVGRTFAVFAPVLRNGFVSYDDEEYVVRNSHV